MSKILKKVFSFGLVLFLLVGMGTVIEAEKRNISFVDPYQFTIETSFSEADHNLVVTELANQIIYAIFQDEVEIASWTYEKINPYARNITAYRHLYTTNIVSGVKHQNEVVLEMYYSGNYRQFRSLDYNLGFILGSSAFNRQIMVALSNLFIQIRHNGRR